MRFEVDEEAGLLRLPDEGTELPLWSPEAFRVLSRSWVRVGWALKYQYSFSWMGRPVIQLPEDLVRMQEVLYRVQPDVIVETGVAHGGSLVFYASLFAAMGRGRVVGIDIEIRPHNRSAIETHELSHLITLVEGSSTDADVVREVRGLVQPGERVLVVLDSNHTRAHVADELEAYAPMVSPGSYLVATDGIMYDLADVPRGGADWAEDNPRTAVHEFLARHPEFSLEEPPPFPFNEGQVTERFTHWPDAFLRRN